MTGVRIPARAPLWHASMKQKFLGWSQRYIAALRKDLKPGHRKVASVGVPQRLGREAVALGLKTLDLAQIHLHALSTLIPPRSKRGLVARAGAFFYSVQAPLEATRRTALPTQLHLARLQETLGQRTQELAATNRRLRRGVLRRKVRAKACLKSDAHHQKSLQESLQLQKRLRQLTHRVLAAQEADRREISVELQDEIAQTLVGINLRLLSLKLEAQGNTKGLKNQIANAQQLVLSSVKSVRQFARKLNSPPPAFSDFALAIH
jgi:signal transduction histidine kinase